LIGFIMAKERIETTTEHQIGIIIGTINGMKDSIKHLSDQFDEHLKEHRRQWLWIIPTGISLATLAVLVVSCIR